MLLDLELLNCKFNQTVTVCEIVFINPLFEIGCSAVTGMFVSKK